MQYDNKLIKTVMTCEHLSAGTKMQFIKHLTDNGGYSFDIPVLKMIKAHDTCQSNLAHVYGLSVMQIWYQFHLVPNSGVN